MLLVCQSINDKTHQLLSCTTDLKPLLNAHLASKGKDLGRHGILIVSVLNSGSSCPNMSPGRGHCVVFLDNTLFSHSSSLHPGI